jgi:hypothetical protein
MGTVVIMTVTAAGSLITVIQNGANILTECLPDNVKNGTMTDAMIAMTVMTAREKGMIATTINL